MLLTRWRLCGLVIGVTVALGACGGGGGDSAPPGPPPPNPLYVRTSGLDTNSGADPANALRTIGKAAQLARSGYRIIVGPGSYSEGNITTASVGVAPQGLQFIADPPGSVNLVSPGGSGAGFNLFSSVGSVIDGFTISGFADAGIVIKSRSDNFTIQNCIVFSNPGDGIRVQDSRDVSVFNNLVHSNGGDGIKIAGQESGSPDADVLSNTSADNGGYGIVVGNTNAASPRAVVSNNIVQGNSGDANIKVFTSPRSDQGYAGDYNLVFAGTYLPTSARGAHDRNVNALFTMDYHVQANSPGIDGGGPLNIPNSQSTILRSRTTDGLNLDRGAFDLGFHFLR